MNDTHFTKTAALLAAALLALLPACSRNGGHREPADHDGAGETKPGEKKICKEHDVPLEECGICQPEGLAKLKPGESAKLRLASPESATLAGVRVASAQTGAAKEAIECYAEIAFDQNKLARIAAPVSGIVESVDVDLGSTVSEKQSVARLWSATIAEASSKAVLARQALAREQKLRAQKATSEKDLQEAEAALQAAHQQLQTLGFSEEQIAAMDNRKRESVLLPLRAPFAGEIVERSAVRGAMVEAGKPLFTVADRSTMWAFASVPESALARVCVGQEVELRVEAIPGRVFGGKVTWVAAEVDDRTRMARVRVEVPNPGRLLKANLFAQARIFLPGNENAVLVPDSAIQRVEGNTMVFVQKGPDLFDARAVRLGVRSGGQVELAEGLQPGEQVVVAHGYPLKSQLLISHLGAGCADD
ncbi:MAG: efflux RND transporter periplasmic adaptor subunit [Chthoniobacteraceae bacterium]|nr:efflux RND transporter periplasmic adaptor subunit [Chthoniobacteraceae bacterium]